MKASEAKERKRLQAEADLRLFDYYTRQTTEQAKRFTEQVVTDPTTGGRKGQKLAQFSQIPPDVLWELAEHFAKGARKYPDDECACAEIAEKTAGTTPKSCASSATCCAGKPPTQTTSKGTDIESALPNTARSLLDPAVSAGLLNDVGSLTTITPVAPRRSVAGANAASVDPSATTATSSSARLKSTAENTSTRHLPGCSAGRPNWQRGYDWRLSVDASERHFKAWQMGEDFDPETGSSHLVAAIWHLMVLRWFQLNDRGTDYR